MKYTTHKPPVSIQHFLSISQNIAEKDFIILQNCSWLFSCISCDGRPFSYKRHVKVSTHGNEISKKLKSLSEELLKIKLKNTVTMQQEKLSGEKTQTIQKEQMELREVQQSLRLKEEEMSKLQEHLEATVQKLEREINLLQCKRHRAHLIHQQYPVAICLGPVLYSTVCRLCTALLSLSMPHPVSSALASDNYSKIFVPTIRMNTASLIPRVPGRGLQVHFNPMVSNSTSSPVCDSKVVPSTSTPTMTAASTKMESVGSDMKYLQKRDGSNAVLTQGVPLQMASYPSNGVLTRTPVSKPGNPLPRVSAYFPGQQPRPPAS
uniref:Uncharacterized protein n=1 Tax=Callorhinchus milii TaxID=7868 RepID=A0A4W3JKA5_CALMI